MTSASPDQDPATASATEPAASEPAGPAVDDDVKARFREALARKKGAHHPDDSAGGGSRTSARSGGPTRREFRRKSGG